MNVTAALLTTLHARNLRKSAYYFPHWKHSWLKLNEKTHFCFDCVGCEGYTLDEDGKVTNHLAQTTMDFADESITVEATLADTDLALHLGTYQGYREHPAKFVYSQELVTLAESRGGKIRLYDPMKHHNEKHTAVTANIQDYPYVDDWLQAELSDDFPYVVCIQ